MNKFDFLPESCYVQKNMTINEVRKAFLNDDIVVGKVISISERKKKVFVRLGDNLTATLPFSEATIYPFEYSKTNTELTLPLQIIGLRYKTICAKVKSICGTHIELSRKDSMLAAFEYLKNKQILPLFIVNIDGIRVYGDIGCGLQAKIDVYNLCKSRIYSATEICNINDCITVKVLSFDELKRFNVSHKEAFPPYDPDNYSFEDTIVCRVNSEIDDLFSGYYMYIDPQVSGILDYDESMPKLNYGDTVECFIVGAAKSGLRLRFIRIIDRA